MSKTKKKFKDTAVGSFLLQKIPKVVGAIAEDTPVGNVIEAIIGGSNRTAYNRLYYISYRSVFCYSTYHFR